MATSHVLEVVDEHRIDYSSTHRTDGRNSHGGNLFGDGNSKPGCHG